MRIACISLGVSGEDGVHQDKGANDFRTQADAFAVAFCELIGATSVGVVVNEDEYHATEGPCNAKNVDTTALVGALFGFGLGLVADDVKTLVEVPGSLLHRIHGRQPQYILSFPLVEIEVLDKN
ncbi:hypothetical protein L1987_71063 [Smallanthus sonchifolius]|uniref:Uncharacterized protein n=1 Tax=Smallanthus sonchifolius TaxID=185202 RepID=A0ACB9ARC7_9ASTR|nr:hypothetical protein L1987_71063 [Smallanthus sonchifolius]